MVTTGLTQNGKPLQDISAAQNGVDHIDADGRIVLDEVVVVGQNGDGTESANQGGDANKGGEGGNGIGDYLLEAGLKLNEAGEKSGTIITSAFFLAKKSGVSKEALEEAISGTKTLTIIGRVTGVINILNNGAKFLDDPGKNWWNGVEALGQSAAMIAGYATGVEEIEVGYNAATLIIDTGIEYYKHK